MNYNKNTDVNETEFDDLKPFYEITDACTIIELIGVPVILSRYHDNFDYLYKHTVDVAGLCWNNLNKHGEKLQHTMIQFKTNIDDTVVYELPLNRFMMSLVFIKPVIDYINDINIEDFILKTFLSKKLRNKIQKKIVEVLMSHLKQKHGLIDSQRVDAHNLLNCPYNTFKSEPCYIGSYITTCDSTFHITKIGKLPPIKWLLSVP
jgi:hypothetical protein